MTTTHTIDGHPWVVPGAPVVVLAGGYTGSDFSELRTVEKVGKLHVVLDNGDKYGAKEGPTLLRRAGWRDSWRSAPRLVAPDSDDAWRAWCNRRVSSAASRVLADQDALRRTVHTSAVAKAEGRAEAREAALKVERSIGMLRQVLELDPDAKPEGWQGIPTP